MLVSDKKYVNGILSLALKIDQESVLNKNLLESANNLCSFNDKVYLVEILRKMNTLIELSENRSILQLIAQLKDEIIKFEGYQYIKGVCEITDNQVSEQGQEYSIDEILLELNNLVGLNNVKSIVNELISYYKVRKLRESYDLFSEKNTLHLAFTGNPGTGKTTVARILGKIYKSLGLISKGHFVEVSRTDLIAGYQGQTALKVKEVINRSIGGVLFIDEAYSITENDHSDAYGKECLTELTKALEDHRDDLVVIVAGYTKPMEIFFESNPGLKSRFNTFLEFENYNADELLKIFHSLVDKNNYILASDAELLVKQIIEKELDNNSNFANGRYVRNFFNKVVMQHAKRVVKISNPAKQDLMTFVYSDISAP